MPISAELLEPFPNFRIAAHTARVSRNKSDVTPTNEEDAKLIENLIRWGHAVPLEGVNLRFHLCAPYRIMVHILRHRMSSPVASSARLGDVDLESFDFVPAISTVAQVIGARISALDVEDEIVRLAMELKSSQQAVLDKYADLNAYIREQEKSGIVGTKQRARIMELAAMALPQGAYVNAIISLNFSSFCNVCRKRLGVDAQPETRELVHAMVRSFLKWTRDFGLPCDRSAAKAMLDRRFDLSVPDKIQDWVMTSAQKIIRLEEGE